MIIFQNFAKINDFSSYGKNDDLPSLNQIDDIFKFLAKNDDFSKFGQNLWLFKFSFFVSS